MNPHAVSEREPDSDLIERCKRKPCDQEAWGFVWDRYGSAVRRVASRYVRDQAEADDVLVDAFSRAYQYAQDYDPRKGGFRSWLLMIARSAALDERRRRIRQHYESLFGPDFSDLAETISESAIPSDIGEEVVQRATARLQSMEEIHIFKDLIENKPLHSIAESRSRSEKFVRKVRDRCVNAVVEVLGEMLPE